MKDYYYNLGYQVGVDELEKLAGSGELKAAKAAAKMLKKQSKYLAKATKFGYTAPNGFKSLSKGRKVVGLGALVAAALGGRASNKQV